MDELMGTGILLVLVGLMWVLFSTAFGAWRMMSLIGAIIVVAFGTYLMNLGWRNKKEREALRNGEWTE